jgi:primosomal protein N' (replication factor Y) (superfamily II helicase)
VKGPALPQIPRVNTFYMLDYLIKIEKNANAIRLVKEAIAEATYQMQHTEGYSTMRVSVNVDPY